MMTYKTLQIEHDILTRLLMVCVFIISLTYLSQAIVSIQLAVCTVLVASMEGRRRHRSRRGTRGEAG